MTFLSALRKTVGYLLPAHRTLRIAGCACMLAGCAVAVFLKEIVGVQNDVAFIGPMLVASPIGFGLFAWGMAIRE